MMVIAIIEVTMAQVGRLGDWCTGHCCFPPRPCIQGSTDVFSNGIPVHRQGDMWLVHACPKAVCGGATLAKGSSTVFANSKQMSRIGDPISDGAAVCEFSPDVFAGG